MDHYSDRHFAVLHTLAKDDILPEFVKSAEITEKEVIDSLPDRAFADPSKRQYPIHTAVDTLLSTAYFMKTASLQKEPDILRRLASAAYGHNVDSEFLNIVHKSIALEKQASTTSDDDYGVIISTPSGPQGLYYMPDAEHIKIAEQYFVQNYKKHPLTWRRAICQTMVKKASENGITKLHPVITAYSGHNVCYSPRAAEQISMRALAASNVFGDNDTALLLSKIARSLEGEMSSPDVLEKVASVLDLIDRTTGLDRYYEKKFVDPYKTIYNMTKEAAEETIAVVDILGNQYTLSDLSAVSPNVYKEALGSDFSSAIMDETGQVSAEKLKDILPTLPRDDKALLKKHLEVAVV